jgi:predicted acetyltransferase
MKGRKATLDDVPLLARLNYQLIRDEGHRNTMTVEELEFRMQRWLGAEGYEAFLFEDDDRTIAYALYRESDAEVHLRQFFVDRDRRQQGVGRRAMQILFGLWPKDKRLTVSVLTANRPGVAFWRAVGYADYDLTLEIIPPS